MRSEGFTIFALLFMHKGEFMLRFYDINEEYIQFLKSIDSQVPDIKYESNNKFVCGIVLNINDVKYYAPISHKTNKQQTNLQIFDNKIPISTIRFSFMIPAFDEVLQSKNFKEIAKTNPKYASLLYAEYSYCNSHIKEIQNKAFSVYKIGCNKNHRLNYTCCDFKKLESEYLNFKNRNIKDI